MYHVFLLSCFRLFKGKETFLKCNKQTVTSCVMKQLNCKYILCSGYYLILSVYLYTHIHLFLITVIVKRLRGLAALAKCVIIHS